MSALLSAQALAAPEDRGSRGWWISGGAGLATLKATADDGQDAGSATGIDLRLRVGETVRPGLSLGLAFSYQKTKASSALFTSTQGALLLSADWRPWPDQIAPLLINAGVGFGVGVLSPEAHARGDEIAEGITAGAAWCIGAAYAFEPTGDTRAGGFALAPIVTLYWLPAQGGEPTRMVTVALGVEGFWFFGR